MDITLPPAYRCRTLTDAIARYGAIDFASRHWPDSGKWVKLLEIPQVWFPNWHVMGTKMPVRHIACNLDMHQALYSALNSVYVRGLGQHLKTFDGCFNIRAVRGRSSPSTHSYGLAIDIDARTNPMSKLLRTDLPGEFVRCFTDQSFSWGGDFHSRKDPMHFSFAWE